MNTGDTIRRAWRSVVLALSLACLAAPALAGQNCEARRPTVDAISRDLALAASVARQLDELAQRDGSKVVLIARAGQDLSQYGLRYSHLGIAYRDDAALDGRGAWRVLHKLNQCGSGRSSLYRQGLAEFFGDGLYLHEAGVVALEHGLAARVIGRIKDDALLASLHEPRYNMLAYPWSGPYQQSNQWAIETLAMLAEPTVNSRAAARDWLRASGYRPTTLQIDPLKRLGARVATAHISFDDHPFGRRMAGQIETVTVDSVFAWMERSGLGKAPLRLRTVPPLVFSSTTARPVERPS
ncbi:MAG: hypothetical protein AW08_03414 [Candidatus Accumulibacter adjunctus]|uniref:DUF2145 domain-containing protein n=1 Tax=Candidatus Accumulibacter adjunctus TaxID=1454001 RepID=A0A011NKL3_9PROT|nr:MAG: hypothetical protein AW08_03414 [Candidatus Accumulibacter adjunctus]